MPGELDYYETLDRWQELQATIKQLQAEERALREGIFEGSFPDPVEGTNTIELPDGRKLKAVYKIYRNTDEDAYELLPVGGKEVFRAKHVLSTTLYRALSDAKRAVVDRALTIKPAGLPTLSIVAAKNDKVAVTP